MKNVLKLGMLAGVVFGISAGSSWFLQSRKSAATAEAPAESAENAAATSTEKTEVAASNDAAELASSGHGAANTEQQRTATDQLPPVDKALPGSIRPRPVSVEELLRYSLGLKSREESVRQREKDIDRRQAQVNIALTDIQGEQHELDGLRRQVKDQLATVESMLTQVSTQREQLESDRQKAETELKKYETSRKEEDSAQRDNVKRMSAWFQSMEPEKAADVLKGLANEGKMELAIQLLANFEEREASKVLAAIDDTTLTVELAEAFRNFKRPAKKEEARR